MLDAEGLADLIAELIAEETEPLVKRIAELEARPSPERGEKGEIGPRGERGEKGEPGQNGRDGFSLDNFDIRRGDDERTLILSFQHEDWSHEYEVTLKHPLYCGIYAAGQEYMTGDVVTWGGSMWIAERDTSAKPDTADSGWRLAVKKGRDGKNA